MNPPAKSARPTKYKNRILAALPKGDIAAWHRICHPSR